MILVTGGTGLVGSHLLWHLLQKEQTVRAVCREGSSTEQVREVFTFYDDAFAENDAGALFSRIEWFPADMLDLWSMNEAMEGVEKVYHCAANVSFDPSVILGPGNWHRGSAAFFTRIQKGMRYYTEGMTGFVDVRDVCRCMIALMESDISGDRFIINSENLYYRDLFNMIADALGRPRPDKHASARLTEAGWRLAWLLGKITFSKPLLTRDTARSGRRISRFSNRKIRETLGIEFIPISDTISWTASFLPCR
ncbi:MAG: GDP-mannose 4,6-dehydratase [Bacteroidales bacterium]